MFIILHKPQKIKKRKENNTNQVQKAVKEREV